MPPLGLGLFAYSFLVPLALHLTRSAGRANASGGAEPMIPCSVFPLLRLVEDPPGISNVLYIFPPPSHAENLPCGFSILRYCYLSGVSDFPRSHLHSNGSYVLGPRDYIIYTYITNHLTNHTSLIFVQTRTVYRLVRGLVPRREERAEIM